MAEAKGAGAMRWLRAGVALAIVAALILAFVLVGPSGLYLWIKAAHIVAVISWMAGMLYLPRLFVYHAAVERGSPQSETFKVMEQRLLRFIINPAMAATWVLGAWLAWDSGFLWDGWWLWAKLLLVLALSALHGKFVGWVRDFALDQNTRDARFYRIVNEVPTVLMIAIVILVVVKPF